MRVQMIINPGAGRGRGMAAAQSAEVEFHLAGWRTDLRVTSGPGDATAIARAAAGRYDLIAACGGDGTLCEVLNGTQASDTPVAFIPAGTGNDFGRTLGLPPTPREAARQVVAGQPRRLDLMRLDAPPLAAINVIGIGFDAAVAARMNRGARLGGGAWPYLAAVMAELARLRPVKLRLWVDGEAWAGEALLVAIANAQSYGGGMRIAPEACVDDGLLDVVVVEPLGRVEFLRTLPRVFKGTHVRHPAVSCRRGREIIVESDAPAPVMVDGDLRATTPLRVTVAPGAAHLWLPVTPSGGGRPTRR